MSQNRLFAHLEPDLVLDIGANQGESISRFRRLWPEAMIVSFEPRDSALAALREAAAADGNCMALPVALAEVAGPVEMIEFPTAGGSSSLLKPTALLEETRPWARRQRRILVQCARLDDIALPAFASLFAKIDVQGFECEVIRGGYQTFARAAGCVVEIEREPLYEGAGSVKEVDRLLAELGMHRAGAARKVYRAGVLSWTDEVWLSCWHSGLTKNKR